MAFMKATHAMSEVEAEAVDLSPYRVVRGCTCGAMDVMIATWGEDMARWPSAGMRHADSCEMMLGHYMYLIERSKVADAARG